MRPSGPRLVLQRHTRRCTLAQPVWEHADVSQAVPNSASRGSCEASAAFILRHDQEGTLIPNFACCAGRFHLCWKFFFELFLSLLISFWMSGTRHQFAPAVTVKKPIDRAVINRVSNFSSKVCWIWATVAISPLSACAKKGAKNCFSSSPLRYA